MKVLVFIEQRDGKVKSSSREALTTAAKMAGGSANVAGILVGASDTSEVKGFGADKVYTVEGDAFTGYNPMHYAKAVETAISDFGADVVLGIAITFAS